MKKLLLIGITFFTVFTLSSCSALSDSVSDGTNYDTEIANLESEYDALEQEFESLKTENEKIKQDLDNLQISYNTLNSKYKDLEESVGELESSIESLDLNAISLKVEAVMQLDLSAYDSLFDLEDDVAIINTTLSTIQSTINTIANYDLEAIDDLSTAMDSVTSTVDSINSAIDTLNTTLSLLGSVDSDEVEEFKEEIDKLLLDIDLKLNFLRSFDISDYNLTDDEVSDVMFGLFDAYSDFMPGDEFNPKTSGNDTGCLTLTYEICQENKGNPKLYTQNYDNMLEQIEYIKENEVYVELFDDFINTFAGKAIPVFPEEIDKYENGEVAYTNRTSSTSTYEMQYFDEIDGDDYQFDTKFHIIGGTSFTVSLTIDVKEKVLLSYNTEKTINFIFYFDNNKTPLRVVIQETNYPVNTSVTFDKEGDMFKVSYFRYEEMKSRLLLRTVFNGEYTSLLAYQLSYTPDIISFDKHEVYSDAGLFYIEDDTNSYYDYIPIQFYDNWKKVYYREDGELTKIKISKVILDDNSEIIVSDESLDYNDTKIVKADFIYYDSSNKSKALNDHLIVAQGQSSILTTNMPKTTTYNTYMSEYNVLDLHDYMDHNIDMRFDVMPYNYMESSQDITKTKQEVYDDALHLLEVAEFFCSNSSYCYFDNTLDIYMVGGFDENYYDENSYVYYPNNYKRVYLQAIYSGDYEFTGKNPNEYSVDDATVNN